jgi:signal transduction histidine kinase
MFLVIYVVAIGSTAFFKRIMDTYEEKNEILISSLHSKNFLIEDQKNELQVQSEVLKQLVHEKDQNLTRVTQELIKFNHELLQYSYTVSHNLRGPVAQILGLLLILKDEMSDHDKEVILDHIQNSAQALDSIIHDLGKIVEARSDTFNVREKVVFEDEVNQISGLLAMPIQKYGLRISKDLKVNEIFSARLRINHILFTLLSNAIQFRRRNKPPEVRISTEKINGDVVLEIQDNGLGINLDLHGEHIFKPFKRFHPDASGKGVGLYLVKLQVERLHGRIEVISTPGEGTTFLIYLKDWKDDLPKN